MKLNKFNIEKRYFFGIWDAATVGFFVVASLSLCTPPQALDFSLSSKWPLDSPQAGHALVTVTVRGGGRHETGAG